MREAASRGFFLGSNAPFGYRKVKCKRRSNNVRGGRLERRLKSLEQTNADFVILRGGLCDSQERLSQLIWPGGP